MSGGEWCIGEPTSADRELHFFPELYGNHGGALRITSVCKQRFPDRRKVGSEDRGHLWKCLACNEAIDSDLAT